MRLSLTLVTLQVLCLFTPSVHAAQEFIPIQERAQGQSLAGAHLLNDSLYSNPASSSFTNVYSVDGTFSAPRGFAASVLDTKTSGVGGAFGYFRTPVQDFAQPMQGLKLALTGKLSEVFGVGVAGKMVWGPSATGENSKLNDIDAGVLANFQVVQLGLNVRNVVGGSVALAQPREIALGGRINWDDTVFFSVASQSSWTRLSPYQYGFGAEYVSPYYFALKGGYRFQPKDPSAAAWSAGASILSPKVSLHYAVVVPTTDSSKLEHVLGTTLLF